MLLSLPALLFCGSDFDYVPVAANAVFLEMGGGALYASPETVAALGIALV